MPMLRRLSRAPILGILTTLPPFLAVSAADPVTARVVFRNGDQISGQFQSADRSVIVLQPAVPGLGASVQLNWSTDNVAALQLTKSDSEATCVYLSGRPGAQRVNALPGGKLCFKHAEIVQERSAAGGLHVSAAPLIPPSPSPSRQAPDNEANYLGVTAVNVRKPQPTQMAAAAAPAPAAGTPAFPSIWALNINAPESVVQGTQSQQQFGGLFRTDLYAGDQNHFSFSASGSHQHNLSLHKPPQRTDIFDSVTQFSHVRKNQFGVYGVGEWFLNTSLGMAAERSVGAGLLFPSISNKSGNLYANMWFDVRYFDERLYSGKNPHLTGAVVHGEIDYTPSSGSW